MINIPKIPKVAEEQRSGLVAQLLEICHRLRELAQLQRDEIARLKGEKGKPEIKASRLEGSGAKREGEGSGKARGKRPGSTKRRKTAELKIHEVKVLKARCVPAGSRFKGYEDFTVQDLVIRGHNTCYRRERWQSPGGQWLMGELPVEIRGKHFGPTLVAFILEQYYHAHVTQPLLLEELRELEIDISTGQLNRILTEGRDDFHAEKDEILRAGLAVSRYIHVDDTGARHQGRNGYCTHIGNELFAWFESTPSKSRINFLELLRHRHSDYVLSKDALAYMRAQKLAKTVIEKLAVHEHECFANETQWRELLTSLNISSEWHVRIATEGALPGSVVAHGAHSDLVIISDDAGQFNILTHALCWIHAERTINKLCGFGQAHREALGQARTAIWDFYGQLKAYKRRPSARDKAELEKRFDAIFTAKTCYVGLNLALQRLYRNKAELLRVLEQPEIPVHNNLSESDIREYVKKRKISGSTRSDLGRRCRDTFTSLKKTCRKLGVSFRGYLNDRTRGQQAIAPLAVLIRQRVHEPAFGPHRSLQALPGP